MPKPRKDIGDYVDDSTVVEVYSPDPSGLVDELVGMRVFDVGQGDCIGLLDQNSEVFCYIDYGGKNDHPDRGNSQYTRTRLSVSYADSNATIILTHWDTDHFWSAYKKNQDTKDCHWLVPRQMASPTATRFAASLRAAECWPETLNNEKHTFDVGDCVVEIRKCGKFIPDSQNEDRNLTGLAITIVRETEPDNSRCLVLTGDCPFDRIPEFPQSEIRGLVAYHHGSKTHWEEGTGKCISKLGKDGEVVYSFSASNSYGHPSRSNYLAAGWATSSETPDQRNDGKEYYDITW